MSQPATEAPTPTSAVAGRIRTRALPAWPLTVLFVWYPVWWLLGVAPMLPVIIGLLCLGLMTVRGTIRIPGMWLWWVAFLLWAAASAVMLDSAGRMVGFGLRFANLLGDTLIIVYVFNARENLPRRTALRIISVFLGWMAIGGILGMLFPKARITTPVMKLLPESLLNNEFVQELLAPRLAEVQHPWGADSEFIRPSAPFPYTNAWGHAFILLALVCAALAVRGTKRTRIALGLLMAIAAIPAMATLNRGIFVGFIVAVIYLGMRLARRISTRTALRIVGGGTLLTVLVIGSGVFGKVTSRTTTSSTTQDRASLYEETFQRTLGSPLLGWGAPRPSHNLDVSVGTQGHLWYLMFSHGFIGMALFLGALWGLIWATRRVNDTESILMHTVIVSESVMMIFYGTNDIHLIVVMTCAVLLLRPELVRLPPRQQPRSLPGRSEHGPIPSSTGS